MSDKWEELRLDAGYFHVVKSLVFGGRIAEMGPTAFCVYTAIKAHSNLETGKAWPSLEAIAACIGLSDQSVRRAVVKLLEMGLLTRQLSGRAYVYQVIESLPLTTLDGAPAGSVSMPYAPLDFGGQIEQVKAFARTGVQPGSAITVNITMIQAESGSTVNAQQAGMMINVSDAAGKPVAMPADVRERLISAGLLRGKSKD